MPWETRFADKPRREFYGVIAGKTGITKLGAVVVTTNFAHGPINPSIETKANESAPISIAMLSQPVALQSIDLYRAYQPHKNTGSLLAGWQFAYVLQ